MTTGHITGQESHLTEGKPSPGWIMRQAYRRWRELKAICPAGMSMTQFALRWILEFSAVTCAIPGAKRPVPGG